MERIKFNNLFVDNISYNELILLIDNAINNNKNISIGYVNTNTFNLSYKNPKFADVINSFDIVHPDGIGVYFASKFTGQKLKSRLNGSDFYFELIQFSIKNKWSYYFFGHDDETLNRICTNYPGLIINGVHEGYNFDTSVVIKEINNSVPDICIIGLSTPIQENWILENKRYLKTKVIISVGDGIKVFAGTKVRGPVIMRKLGLEWLARLLHNPLKYYKRYLIGTPLFLYRIIKLKFSKLKQLNH
ncbi:MAG: WecB/TagA/CpsF family glycosyltransferase [Ignavibacteriae bacterium]|nr:MAG: WecB/TagA/CpsF family glycosyltransferase [Ignavibacteriota bacterium]